jgi:hypothetical protein
MGRILSLALALAALAAACGGAGAGPSSGGGSGGTGAGGGSSGGSTAPPGTIAGIYLRHGAVHAGGGSPAGGVPIGLYRRPVSFAGPVQMNPPKPIAVARTTAEGRFAFGGLAARRYFVAAMDDHAYAVGRWALPGERVVLRGCTDCPRPL